MVLLGAPRDASLPALLRGGSTPMRIIAFITEAAFHSAILEHLGEPTHRPASPPPPEVRPLRRGTSIHTKAKHSL